MSDSDTDADSDDGLNGLLKKSSVRSSAKPQNTRTPSKVNNNEDELELIEPVDPKRHQLIKNHRLIRQSMDEKSEQVKRHESLMTELRASLMNELSDSGSPANPTKINKIIDKLLAESKDTYNYQRNFFFLDAITSGKNWGSDQNLIAASWGSGFLSSKTVLSAMTSTDLNYLKRVDKELDRQLAHSSTADETLINIEYHHLGILESQSGNPFLIVKLAHHNPQPDINIARISVALKWEFYQHKNLCKSAAQYGEHLHCEKSFDWVKVFFLTLCDTNALQYNYPELLTFARIYLRYSEFFPTNLQSSLDSLFIVGIYGETREFSVAKYRFGLYYTVLNLLNTALNSESLTANNSQNKAKVQIEALTLDFLGYENFQQYFQFIYEFTHTNLQEMFSELHNLNTFYKIHYGLRLLQYVKEDTDWQAGTLKRQVDILSKVKSRYHKLMGAISFSTISDPYNCKYQVIQMLDEDYNHLNYYFNKHTKYLGSVSNDFFYE